MKFFKKYILFILWVFIANSALAQIRETAIEKYYLVVASFKSKLEGETYVDKLNAQGKENFFLMNLPTQKIFRVCIAKGTKEKMLVKRQEILKDWNKAWLLEM